VTRKFKPIARASSTGFAAQELHKLLSLVGEYQRTFEEAWNELFET